MVESESDSDQSNQDAQRSVQTGATAGSDTGIFLLLVLLHSDIVIVHILCTHFFWLYNIN